MIVVTLNVICLAHNIHFSIANAMTITFLSAFQGLFFSALNMQYFIDFLTLKLISHLYFYLIFKCNSIFLFILSLIYHYHPLLALNVAFAN